MESDATEEKDGGGRMKDESDRGTLRLHFFHPSSFILHPYLQLL
jgi:hypothetical protein